MPTLVADTPALVSLGIAADADPDPLALCLNSYDVHVPEIVLDELQDVAEYDDEHGRSATTVLDRTDDLSPRSVDRDPGFPLDEGENAAVTLANEIDTALLLCDEFDRVGLIHASLADTRLVTSPTLLSVFVRADQLPAEQALTILDEISAARSWDANSYVQRARSLLEDT